MKGERKGGLRLFEGKFDGDRAADFLDSMGHWLREGRGGAGSGERAHFRLGTGQDDVIGHDFGAHKGMRSFLNGGGGEDHLRLELDTADWLKLAPRLTPLLEAFQAQLDGGPGGGGQGGFFFRPLGLRVSQFESVELVVDGQRLTIDDDPVRVRDDRYRGNTDEATTGNVTDNDRLPDLLKKVKLLAGPAEGTLTLERDGSFSFDPSGGFADLPVNTSREVSFRYVAIDADGDRDRGTVTLTIDAENHAPVAHDMRVIVTDDMNSGGHVIEFPPSFTDTDFADRFVTTLDVDWVAMGSADVFVGPDGEIVFEAVGFESLAPGETAVRSFDFTVTDIAGARSTASVTATIFGTNQAPVAHGVHVYGDEDAPVIAADVTAAGAVTDPDNGDSHTIQDIGLVTHGSATISADGTQILFTPEADFAGEAEVVYRLTDSYGAVSDAATAVFHVAPVADTPEISVKAVAGERADQFYVDVTGVSTDADRSEVFNAFRLEVLDAAGNLLPDQASYLPVTEINPASGQFPFSQDGTETVRFLVTLPGGAGQDIALRATAQVWDPMSSDPKATATATDTLDVTWTSARAELSRDFGFANHSIWASAANQRHQATLSAQGELEQDTSFGGTVFYADLTVGGTGPKAHISSAFDAEVSFDVDVDSTFWVEGGAVRGGLNYQASAEVLHNDLTDQLRFSTHAQAVPGWSWFEAGTPNAGFDVRLMDGNMFFDAAMKVWGYAHLKNPAHTVGPTFNTGIDMPELSIDLNPLLPWNGLSLAAWDGYRLSALNGAVSVPASHASGTVTDNVFGNTIVDWAVNKPSFTTRSDNYNASSVFSGVKSQQVASLAFDIDGIASTVAGKKDPVDWSYQYPDGYASNYVNFRAWLDIVDVDLVEALSYGQRHVMTPGALAGTLVMENGDRFAFTFGDAVDVGTASQYDANGDGHVSYAFELTPSAQFRTEASLIFQEYDRVRLLDAGVSGTIGFGSLASQSLGIGTNGYWKTWTGTAINRGFTQGLTSQDFALDLDTVTSGGFLI